MMVVLDNVQKIYRMDDGAGQEVYALAGVSAQVTDGEFSAVAGPSGSGKTTLLNLVGCLDTVTSGHILIDGTDIADLDAGGLNDIRLKKIGFIFQNYNLLPVLSVLENVELALSLLGTFSKKEIRERSRAILAEVGLEQYLNRLPSQLSGGQQQRVSIARALVKNPAVILADEPTANLDSANSVKILELMRSLNETHGITFIFSTHDATVMEYCRRIIRLKDGRICGDTASEPAV